MAAWDYELHGGQYRDVSDDVISDLIKRGQLQGQHKICYTGTANWKTIDSFPVWRDLLNKSAVIVHDNAKDDLPDIGTSQDGRFYFVWFVFTVATSAYSWYQAESYNPEGNGMFNLVEASLLNHAWLQVIAALLTAIFSSIFLAAAMISRRIRNLTEINRAGYLALIKEARQAKL